MSSKILNRSVVYQALTGRFWESERHALFADDFRIEFPNAAPGIPQILEPYEVGLYFDWLRATVESYSVEAELLLGTPDPDVFWTVSMLEADVHWGGRNGHLSTKRFARYELRDGKIVLLHELSNPLKWLEAAGRTIPVFRMDLTDSRITAALTEYAETAAGLQNTARVFPPEDTIARNLTAFMNGDYWKSMFSMISYAPDYRSKVWFLPPEMDQPHPPEMQPYLDIWSLLSCPVFEFDRNGRVWETDDPHIYFCEYHCFGVTDWIGNNCPNSRYRNRYVYVLRFNDAGQIQCCEEVLNPINKYNSINVSVPSFPYYY